MWTAAEMRRRRREAGLCTECGKSLPLEGKRVCAACFEKQREYNRRKTERNRAREKIRPENDRRGEALKALRKWEYVAWRGNTVVFRGTSREVAAHFGMTQNEVCNYARVGTRRRMAGVYIEREAIKHGNQDL